MMAMRTLKRTKHAWAGAAGVARHCRAGPISAAADHQPDQVPLLVAGLVVWSSRQSLKAMRIMAWCVVQIPSPSSTNTSIRHRFHMHRPRVAVAFHRAVQ